MSANETIFLESTTKVGVLNLARNILADSDTMIIPYKVINRIFTTLYGIITGSVSADFSRAKYNLT